MADESPLHAGLFVEAGRRAHVIWRQDGTYSDQRERSTEIVNPPGGGSEGIWVEPWRVADGLEVAVGQPDGSEAQLGRFAVDYQRQDGVSCITSRLPEYPALTFRKRVWVPLSLPAAVVELTVENGGPSEIRLETHWTTRLRLSLGWPLGTSAPARVWVDDPAGLLRAQNPLGQAALASQPSPRRWRVEADRAAWDTDLVCPARAETRLRLVVAATAGGDDPGRVARKALLRADDLLRLRVEHYERCTAAAPRLKTPNPELDRAFSLTRPTLEDFKHHDPAIGLGYFAGYPAYNFYFAGDAFRMLYGACALGDWADTREALRTIVRGQRDADDAEGQLVGELWHELSTTGHQISPNFVTLELPSILLHYARWSGDLDLVRELFPAAALAGAWARRKDADGDGLPDNGPEQTFADGVREDLNVAGAHLTPALWQLRAQAALAELARLLGDASQVRAWRRRAARTRRLVEATFWDAERRAFVETIRPDGVADTGPGFVSALEPSDDLAVHLRTRSLEIELEEERALRQGGLGAAASFPAAARQARAYYVMDRGDRARRLLQAGWAEDGAAALGSIARLPFRGSQAGFFPEIASRAEELADPRGCFHQGWTAGYGLAYPVVAGLWGLRPDAPGGRLEVSPTPPADWSHMQLEGLRVGRAELDLGWRRLAEDADDLGAELVVACRGGWLDLTVWLACPPGARRLSVLVNDRRGLVNDQPGSSRPRRRRDPGTERVGLRLRVQPGRAGRVVARWSTSSLSSSPPPSPTPGPSTPPDVRHIPPGDATHLLGGRDTDAQAAAPRPIVRHAGAGDATGRGRGRHTAAGDRRVGRSAVVYCGFVAPPLADPDLDLRHVPLNYANRRPAALLDLLPTARVLLLTDQQDAPLSDVLASAIAHFVQVDGGSLLVFCAWSAAWGRGFFDTYCSIAGSAIPDLLPLGFRQADLQTTRRLRLRGPGQALWADLPWPDAPPIDYQPARLRPGARGWALAEPVDGAGSADEPLAASWTLGAGRVVAIGLDTFGFGHGTLVHWPGRRPLLRRALDWLLLGGPT